MEPNQAPETNPGQEPEKAHIVTIGPTIGIIIIVVVLLLGALYILGGKFQKDRATLPATTETTQSQN